MKKFLLLLTITLLFNQCGYEKVYSGKNLNLFINEIKRENNSINNELSDAYWKYCLMKIQKIALI